MPHESFQGETSMNLERIIENLIGGESARYASKKELVNGWSVNSCNGRFNPGRAINPKVGT